jgi:cytochrome P450
MRLPPGPRGPLHLIRYLRDPYGATMRLFERFGDPHTVRALGSDLVTTGDPELIKTILAADPDGYDAFGVDHIAPAIGRESLMMVSGERHRAQRKVVTPPFHGTRMRAYGAIIREVAREAVAGWPRDRAFAVQPSTRAISLRVIPRAVLGVREPDEVARFERMIVRGIDALRPSLLFVKALQHRFGGLGPWARFLRRRRAMEELIYAELAARRQDDASREDILSLIMAARYDDGSAMSDRQIFETVMTVIVAGHETTAIAIAWALWYVLRDAAVRDRLRVELATVAAEDVDAIAKLPYLEAVCHETLRIQPIAGSVARVLRSPMTLGDYELPAGVCVAPSIIALHRRPELYPDPDTFRPERFLERRFAPHEYMPFGGGHRRCIGAAFAQYEMKIVLATILTEPSLALRLASPDVSIGAAPRNTVIGPRRAIELIASQDRLVAPSAP